MKVSERQQSLFQMKRLDMSCSSIKTHAPTLDECGVIFLRRESGKSSPKKRRVDFLMKRDTRPDVTYEILLLWEKTVIGQSGLGRWSCARRQILSAARTGHIEGHVSFL